MKHQVITVAELLASFPHDHYPEVLLNQQQSFEAIAQHDGTVTIEAPPGSGKTATGYTFLNALRRRKEPGALLFVVPSKVIALQVLKFHPDVKVAFGRNEHPCLYYKDAEGVTKPKQADEVPCSFLVHHPTRPCQHYVDQGTGKTHEPGAEPCPYFFQKFEARQPGTIAVVTGAFALFAQVFQRQFGELLAGTVIDEAHKIARAFRSVLSYDITDYHIELCVKMCRDIGADEEAAGLDEFRKTLIRIVDRRQANRRLKNQPLLKRDEVQELLDVLQCINEKKLEHNVKQAIRDGKLDVEEQMETLKHMETILRDLRRYITSLGYAIPTEKRGALNYLYAYYRKEKPEETDKGQKVRYRLVVKAYRVTGLVQKLLGKRSLTMSGTIGSKVFCMETGIESPIVHLKSDFEAENTRIYLPIDTADLSKNKAGQGQPGKTMRRIAEACGKLAEQGHRSLILVVSNDEREQMYRIAQEYGLDAQTYGNSIAPKDMAVNFKNGEGTVLIGTIAQYGEGLDMKEGIAPVTHVLRPAWPNPIDPEAQFEKERFGNNRWALWTWRVMTDAQQNRGRNVRSKVARGVTIFYSQSFRKFLFSSLAEWLQPSYRGEWRLERCIEDTIEVLGRAA